MRVSEAVNYSHLIKKNNSNNIKSKNNSILSNHLTFKGANSYKHTNLPFCGDVFCFCEPGDAVKELKSNACVTESDKKEILLKKDCRGSIPLHYADKKDAKLLLGATKTDDTLKEMLLCRDKRGDIPFANADTKTKEIMLEFSPDSETKIRMLSDPSVVFRQNGMVSSMDLVKNFLEPDEQEKAKLAIIQAVNPKNNQNILHAKLNGFYNAIELCENYPEILAKLLVQEDDEGEIPVEKYGIADKKSANLLLKVSPDDETYAAQLLHTNKNSVTFIDTYNPYFSSSLAEFNFASDENVSNLLFHKIGRNDCPVIAYVKGEHIIDILDKVKNPEVKKEILLAKWHDIINDKYTERVNENMQSDMSYNQSLVSVNAGKMSSENLYFLNELNGRHKIVPESVAEKLTAIDDGNMISKLARSITSVILSNSTTHDEVVELVDCYDYV